MKLYAVLDEEDQIIKGDGHFLIMHARIREIFRADLPFECYVPGAQIEVGYVGEADDVNLMDAPWEPYKPLR